VIHEIIPVGMLQCNCSIFGDETTREAVVIDPGDQIEDIQAILERHQLTVKAIVITHAHIDHIGGAAKLKAATNAPVYMNANDQDLYDHLDMQAAWLGTRTPARTSIDTPAREGDSIALGETPFHVIHTPGHTQGSISLWIPAENKLIAGAVPRQHRPHRSARRRRSADPPIHSHQADDAAGGCCSRPGARAEHDHRA
jgi:hydroxyacylglutathione hydrolase